MSPELVNLDPRLTDWPCNKDPVHLTVSFLINMDNPAVANALGTLGAVCWSIQLIPQIILNLTRAQHTTGLQPSMMLLWASAGVPLGVYNIVSEFNIALRIQPQILTVLSLITWSQCCYYGKGWKLGQCAAYLAIIACLMGAIELGLIFAVRKGLEDRAKWPNMLMAVLAAVLLAAGVLRHYWDIYTHRTVRGISFLFVGIDAAGDLFSLVSIFFQETLDVLGMAIYGTELALWVGIFACGGWFNLGPFVRTRLKRWRDERRSGREDEEPDFRTDTGGRRASGVIALHENASSTSVFRTPSTVLTARPVAGGEASPEAIDV